MKEDFRPSVLNQPGQQYPMVNSQGYARFRVVAPDAKSVIVSLGLGGRGGTVLRKDKEGVWVGTTDGPMDEGFHYYHLTIDGGVFNDPGTKNYYGSCRWESGIEIPAHDEDFYAMKQVLMEMFNRFIFIPRAQIPIVVHLFIHRPLTERIRRNIRFSICSTDGEKMKRHGPTRDMRI